jgi:arylformamidase
VKLVYAEGYNHYEIAETIANPYGFVGRAILEQMGLAPAG